MNASHFRLRIFRTLYLIAVSLTVLLAGAALCLVVMTTFAGAAQETFFRR
jgi:hypothetical protein